MRYRICKEYGDKTVKLFYTHVPGEEAQLALSLLEKWGPVCTTPDGEDKSGRRQWRDLTPVETVTRAFEIAQVAFYEAQKRGLMLEVPDLNEINQVETPDVDAG